jgi:hypothetical protein
MDADDSGSLRETEGHKRVVGEPQSNHVTAVRNWNAAAVAATGDLLFVVADDLFPHAGWDTALRRLVEPIDPDRIAFAVKISDSSAADDVLMRHPIVSREFYRRHGLFCPEYRGVYCDNDITLRAFWSAVILDGRSIEFVHRHPAVDAEIRPSDSQDRINAVHEYEQARALHERRWSRRRRSPRVRLMSVNPGAEIDATTVRWIRLKFVSVETISYPGRRFTQLGRRALRGIRSVCRRSAR